MHQEEIGLAARGRRLRPILRWVGIALKYGFLLLALVVLGAAVPGMLILAAGLCVLAGFGTTCYSLFKLRSPKAAMESALIYFILMPIAISAVLIPIHALYYFFLEHIPAPLTSHFMQNPWQADLALPAYDGIVSLAAALALPAIALVILRERYWLGLHIRQIENLATSKVSAAALGVVELIGAYQPGPEPEPTYEWGASRLKKPFYLEDATGRVLVDPAGTQGLAGVLTSAFRLELAEVSLAGESLKPGDPLFVVGLLDVNESAPAGAVGPGALVVRRPGRGVAPIFKRIQEFRQELLGGGAKGRTLHDTFFIADGDEAAARNRLRVMHRNILWRGAVMLAACLWLLVSRLDRLYPQIQLPDDPAYYTEDPAVHRLLTYAYHPVEGYRQWAFAAIRRGDPAIPITMRGALALDLFLNSPYPDSRSWAAWNLEPLDGRDSNPCNINPSYSRFAPRMAEVLLAQTSDQDSRMILLRLLNRIREPRQAILPAVTEVLQHDREPWLRQVAAEVLGNFAPEKGSVTPVMASALSDPDPAVRAPAEAELEHLAPGAMKIRAVLAAALFAEDDSTRWHARKGLVRYGNAALPAFEQAFQTGTEAQKAEAVWGVLEVQPTHEWVMPFLKRALQAQERAPRQAALAGVEGLKAAGQPLYPDVVALLRSPDATVAHGVIPTLAKLEPPPVLMANDWTVIRQSLRAPEDFTRRAAIQLLKVSPLPRQEIVAELLVLAQSPANPEIHADMLMGLAEFSPEAGVAVPYLVSCLAQPQLRGLAATVLGKLGTAGLPAAPQLVALVQDLGSQDRKEAADALRGIGAYASLGDLVQHPDATVRGYAFEALRKSGPAGTPAIPGLIQCLAHSDRNTVLNALNVLITMGPAARAALPAIRDLVAHGSPDNRPWNEAGEAIVQLATPEPPSNWAEKQVAPPVFALEFENSLADQRSQKQFTIVSGQANYTASLQGQCLTLDAATRLQWDQTVDLSQGYTLEIAFRFAGKSPYYGGEPTVLDCDLLRIYSEGAGRSTVWLPDTRNLGNYASNPQTNPPQWQHTAVVWNPYKHVMQVFVNGRKIHDRRDYDVGTEVEAGVRKLSITFPQHQLRMLMLGSRRDQTHPWNGAVDDLKLYDYPRSEEQISGAAGVYIAKAP